MFAPDDGRKLTVCATGAEGENIMVKQAYIVVGLFLLVSMSIVVLPRPSGAAGGEPAAAPLSTTPLAGAPLAASGASSSNVKSLAADSISVNFKSLAAEHSATLGQASLKFARRGHTATALADGRVLIVGGENEDGPVRRAEIVDPSSQAIKSGPNSVIARTHHTATSLPDGRIVIIGGSGSHGPLDSIEVYDPARNRFSAGPSLRRARTGHTATLMADGRVLVTGGRSDNSAEIVDPSGAASSLLDAVMTTSRSFHSAIVMKDGNVLIAGGISPDKKGLESAEIFDTRLLTSAAVSKPMYIRRVRPLMRSLPDGKIQVIGGDLDGSMELYDPESRGFGAVAHLVPTADLIPFGAMLNSQTRSAYVDAVDYRTAKFKHPYPASMTESMTESNQLLDRADYSSVEIPEQNIAVIAGGVSRDGQYLSSLEVFRSSPAFITTGHGYYSPGSQPIVTGSGWQPNETVTIVRQDARPDRRRVILEATADGRGNLQLSNLPVASQTDSFNYTITAIGNSSGYVAQTVYWGGLPEIPTPGHVDFSIGLTGRDGSTETAGGLLVWKIRSGGVKTAPPGDDYASRNPTTKGIEAQSVDLGNIVSFLPSGPCLGLDLGNISVQGCAAITAKFLSGHFDVGGSIDGSFDLLAGSASVSVSEHLSAGATLDLQFSGSLSVEDKILPLYDMDITLGPLKGKVEANIVAGLDLTVGQNTPLEIQPSFDFSEEVSAGISASVTDGITFPNSGASESFHASCAVIQDADACAKLRLGPKVEVDFNLPGFKLTGDAFADLYAQTCLVPTTATSTCIKDDLQILGGVELGVEGGFQFGDFSVSSQLLGIDLSHQFFDIPFILKDTSPPVITCPADIVQGTDPGQCSALVNVTPATATDDCSSVTVGGSRADGKAMTDPYPKGVTLINWTATDQKGNTATCVQRVTVLDLEKPVLGACPANIVKSTDPGLCSAVVTFATPTATDNCPGVTVSCSPASGTSFPKGTTTVTCTATDASGNQSTCQFTVTINNTDPPKITCPPNQVGITANPRDTAVTVTYPTPSVSDNCAGATVVCTPASGSVFPVGSTTVNCVATDTSGNTSSCSFTLTVYDVSLQDTSTGDIFEFNSFTGEYVFTQCSTGLTLTGTGTVSSAGPLWHLTDAGSDRQVNAHVSPDNTGTASVLILGSSGQAQHFNIVDRNPQPGPPSCH
jgi:hypothetical protein